MTSPKQGLRHARMSVYGSMRTRKMVGVRRVRIWRTPPPPTARACHRDSVGTHGRRRRPPWRRDGAHELRGACHGRSSAVRRGGVSAGWSKHAYGSPRSLPRADVAVRLTGGLTGFFTMYTDTFAGGGPLNADASGAVTQRVRSPMLTSARRPRRPPGYRPPWSSTQQRR